MNAGARLAAFAVVLGLAAGAGAAVGNAVGPEPDDSAPAAPHDAADATTDAEHGSDED